MNANQLAVIRAAEVTAFEILSANPKARLIYIRHYAMLCRALEREGMTNIDLFAPAWRQLTNEIKHLRATAAP